MLQSLIAQNSSGETKAKRSASTRHVESSGHGSRHQYRFANGSTEGLRGERGSGNRCGGINFPIHPSFRGCEHPNILDAYPVADLDAVWMGTGALPGATAVAPRNGLSSAELPPSDGFGNVRQIVATHPAIGGRPIEISAKSYCGKVLTEHSRRHRCSAATCQEALYIVRRPGIRSMLTIAQPSSAETIEMLVSLVIPQRREPGVGNGCPTQTRPS